MTFNWDFWVVGGTAAPIIALAAVVAYQEAYKSVDARTGLNGALAGYNCLAQTAALALALVSLADRANAAPFAVMIVIECAGIMALFVTAVTVASAQWRAAARVEASKRGAGEGPEAATAATSGTGMNSAHE